MLNTNVITAVGKFKTYILFSIFALLAAANTSCIEEVNIYQDPLWGSWILTYDDYGPVEPYYAEIFYFGSDGYGTLNWVDEWGREYVDDFQWSASSRNIDIFYYNGNYEYYDYYFRNGNLVLDDGYHYREYRRY